MKSFIARQPIFDLRNNVIAYELLFRNGYENSYMDINGDEATLAVIANSFYEFNLKTVSNNKMVFINFTEKLIKDEIATILPSEYVVIEILESVEPTEEIIKKCKKLKEKGFLLALDDFRFNKKYISLLEIVDIIKVDFLITKGIERKNIFKLLEINNKLEFLAEKVENIEEFNEAVGLGYKYFQGYYFSKPKILSQECIKSNKKTALKILKLVNSKDFDFNDLEKLILEDVVISYKLSKLIKSSCYCLKSRNYSIKNAIVFLGEKEIIKWLNIILINDLKGNNSNELIKVSLQRARFCESICNGTVYKEKVFLAYMTGLFSVMDALLNCSMESFVKDIYLHEEIKDALIGKENDLNCILKLAININRGNWEEAEFYANKINVNIIELSDTYFEILKWVDNDFKNYCL